MNTPNLDNLKNVRNPSPLQYAILLYGDEQSASLEDLLDAERAAAILTAMQARIEKLEAVAEKLANVIQWAIDDEEDFTYSTEGMAAIAELDALKGDK